jgi:hypothetical protein
MAFVNKHVTAVRRGRCALYDSRLAQGFDRAIQVDELHLRGRVVIEDLLVDGVFQQILKRRPGCDTPQVFLNDRACRYIAPNR